MFGLPLRCACYVYACHPLHVAFLPFRDCFAFRFLYSVFFCSCFLVPCLLVIAYLPFALRVGAIDGVKIDVTRIACQRDLRVTTAVPARTSCMCFFLLFS